jgi:hypothetical protein
MKTHVNNLQIQEEVVDEKQEEDEKPLVFGLFSDWFLSPYVIRWKKTRRTKRKGRTI